MEVVEGNKITIRRVILLHDRSIHEWFTLMAYLEEKYICV